MKLFSTREVSTDTTAGNSPLLTMNDAMLLAGAILLGIWARNRYCAAQRRRRMAAACGNPAVPAECCDKDSAAEAMHGDSDDFATRFCPVCRTEFVAGTANCEDCGAELVEEEELPPFERPIDESLVGVFRIRSPYKGQLIREYLEAGGIRCVLSRSSLFDMLDADRVLVFESDALSAKKLIREFLHETGIPSTDYVFEPR